VRLSLRARGLLAVSMATVMLSTAGLMTRLVEVDSPTLMFLRGAIGALFLFGCMAALSGRRAIDDLLHLGWSGMLICATSAVAAILFIASLYATSVAHVAIIFATCPFVAAGLALLILGERPTPSALLASGVALLGVFLMVRHGGDGALIGDLFAFAMTVTVALWTVLVRRHPDKPALACTAVAAVMTALIAAPFATPLAASAFDVGATLVFGVFGFSLGIVLLLIGSRLLPPVETALIGALDAPLAPLWVFLVVGEVPHRNTLIGGSVVFLAVCLHIVSGRYRSNVCRATTIDP
jgi:drug/metabolite transporter (DMT)-like permease